MFYVSVDDGEYLLVVASGRGSYAAVSAVFDLGATYAKLSGHRRVMFDLMALDVDLSFAGHLNLGTHIGEALADMERVATAVPPRYRTGTSEKAAQATGLKLRTFTDLPSASAWLSDGPPPSVL